MIVTTPPKQCTNGTTPALGGEINLVHEDTKFPQNLRGNLAYDLYRPLFRPDLEDAATLRRTSVAPGPSESEFTGTDRPR